MRLSTVTLLASVFGAAASAPLCSPSWTTLLSDLEGEIVFDGRSAAADGETELKGCRWHIFPDRLLQGISFNTSVANLDGNDYLSFYSSPNMPDSQYVGRFSAEQEISEFMVMTGTDQAMVILTASSPNTRLRIRYRCLLQDNLLFSLHISPLWLALWMGVWMLLISMCCASTCWIIRYRRAETRRGGRNGLGGTFGAEGNLPHSILLVHAELLRRRERERREAREATERDTNASLLALPTKAWQGLKEVLGGTAGAEGGVEGGGTGPGSAGAAGGGSAEEDLECCLCMDAFEKEDEVRLLPCNHFFHKECIDRWFAARAYQQRSCPLCKRNPLEGAVPCASATAAVAEPATSRSAASQAAPAAMMSAVVEEGAAARGSASAVASASATTAVEEEADGLELVVLPEHPNAQPSPQAA